MFLIILGILVILVGVVVVYTTNETSPHEGLQFVMGVICVFVGVTISLGGVAVEKKETATKTFRHTLTAQQKVIVVPSDSTDGYIVYRSGDSLIAKKYTPEKVIPAHAHD